MENLSELPQTKSFEEKELERLSRENEEKQILLDKQRDIMRLKKQNAALDAQRAELERMSNPKPKFGANFNFNKEKAKFWAIASVVSITVAIVVVNVVKKLF